MVSFEVSNGGHFGTLTSERIQTKDGGYDNGANKTYNFSLEKRNNQDIVTNLIVVNTTTSGEIITFVYVERNPGAASSQTKITGEEAKDLAMKKLNSMLANLGYDMSTAKIIDVKKIVSQSTVFWEVNIHSPGGDPKEPSRIVRSFLVNAITGETNERQ